MESTTTALPHVIIVTPKRYVDKRGFFSEVFRTDRYSQLGISTVFVQDNWSRSMRGVLRGLHLQHPNAQAKLVSVLRGRIVDVAVDVRLNSPTFGRHVAVELSEDNGRQLYIPRGFAHGFAVLSGRADILYKTDNFYSPADEITIRWNDPALAIDWGVSEPLVSERDGSAPLLAEARGLPTFEG